MDVRRSYIPRICHLFATMQVGLTHRAASFPTGALLVLAVSGICLKR